MNSALVIIANDSRVPAIRAKCGSSDLSKVFEGDDILRVRMDT